ncbi:MAG: hypothetical protein H7Y43_16995 [Akkermansiaceae bacterium]|nr:hypothetical protein [Verrucomicrobiales bacterium]
MKPERFASISRSGALLAINLLFLMVWGFTGIGKLLAGVPPWFGDKFGATFMAKFPGLTAAFWILAISEVAAFGLAALALVTGEFAGRRAPQFLRLMLVWSLFVFVQLGFGQWLTSDYNATAQLFAYFAGTLVALIYVEGRTESGEQTVSKI